MIWLFPATYVLHLVEEHFAGGGFPAWADRVLGIQLTARAFLGWNAIGLAATGAAALLAWRYPRLRAIELSLAVAVLVNALAHAVASIATWTYSPGLVSGVLVWLPLGITRLRTVSADASRGERVAGIGLGLIVTVITLAVLAAGLR